MNVASTSSSANTSASLGGNLDWNQGSFREKFGSLFKSDNEKRLEDYASADMAKMQSRVRSRFQVADAKIQDSRDDRSMSMIGKTRTTTAQSVEQSFGPTTGAAFKAMALRA